MDLSEYIEVVTGQMRCKRARAMVAKELTDHINDQTEDYLKDGMEPDAAEREAVRQMGDAVEVGTEMDRLHRPRMDKKVLIIVAIFSLVSIFLQTMVVQAIRAAGMATNLSAKMVPLQVLVGVLIMVGILYLDYTIFDKFGMAIWPVIICILFVLLDFGPATVQGRIYMYFLYGMLLPAYAGEIYRCRKKGWKGLLESVLWIFVAVFVGMSETNRTFLNLMLCLSCLLLLSYALAKGWYGIPRIPAFTVMGGGVLGLLALFLLAARNHDYMMARLDAFINFASDPAGNGYITSFMREGLNDLALWKPAGEWFRLWDGRPVESAMSFYMVLKELGLVPAFLIIAGFLVLFFCMAAGVSKQKNVLGSLMGMACVLGLLIPTLGHIASSLTLIPYTDVYIPFLYPGWVANAASYTLLGLYLSVYRNTDVVA